MTKLIMKLFGIQSSKLMVERLNAAGIQDIYVTDRGGVVVGVESADKASRAAARRIVASDSLKAETMSKGS